MARPVAVPRSNFDQWSKLAQQPARVGALTRSPSSSSSSSLSCQTSTAATCQTAGQTSAAAPKRASGSLFTFLTDGKKKTGSTRSGPDAGPDALSGAADTGPGSATAAGGGSGSGPGSGRSIGLAAGGGGSMVEADMCFSKPGPPSLGRF